MSSDDLPDPKRRPRGFRSDRKRPSDHRRRSSRTAADGSGAEREGGASEASVLSAKLLSKVAVGTRMAVYWSHYGRYYSGVVTAYRRGRAYTIHYDDGDVETVNLAEERFRIDRGTPDAFLVGDERFEVHRPGTKERRGGWRSFRHKDGENVRFCSRSFSTNAREVECNGDGIVYDTCFGEAGLRGAGEEASESISGS